MCVEANAAKFGNDVFDRDPVEELKVLLDAEDLLELCAEGDKCQGLVDDHVNGRVILGLKKSYCIEMLVFIEHFNKEITIL